MTFERQTALEINELLKSLLARHLGSSKREAVERAIAEYLSNDAAARTRALAGHVEIEDVSAELRRALDELLGRRSVLICVPVVAELLAGAAPELCTSCAWRSGASRGPSSITRPGARWASSRTTSAVAGLHRAHRPRDRRLRAFGGDAVGAGTGTLSRSAGSFPASN